VITNQIYICYVFCFMFISCNSDSLVPVITVQLGEPVTFTCPLPNLEVSWRQFYWYKQTAGNTLKIIAALRISTKPDYTPEFFESRLEVTNDKSSLLKSQIKYIIFLFSFIIRKRKCLFTKRT
uniref:Immunoglobulin V-set domain-containing protein n=1 Tax=Lates calcarifer TaxID=8187 RepID=A0A4W6CCW4_LATCA